MIRIFKEPLNMNKTATSPAKKYLSKQRMWALKCQKTQKPVKHKKMFSKLLVLRKMEVKNNWDMSVQIPSNISIHLKFFIIKMGGGEMRDHLVPSCCSVTKLYLTLCNPMDCSTLGSPILHHLPEFAQIHVYWIGDAIQTSHSLSSPSPPALNLSQHQGVFQWVGSSPQVPKYWSFSISTASKYSGLISFRIDWFDLLALQGTLKSLLQHHNLKASILNAQPSL